MYNGALLEAIKSQAKLDKSLRYKSYDKKPIFHTFRDVTQKPVPPMTETRFDLANSDKLQLF
jgi:hypothetical protein